MKRTYLLRNNDKNDGNCKEEINIRFNKEPVAISVLSILYGMNKLRNKAQSYHALVKSTIKEVSGTIQSKRRTAAKLNSTEMDFWRSSLKFREEIKLGIHLLIENECDKFTFK